MRLLRFRANASAMYTAMPTKAITEAITAPIEKKYVTWVNFEGIKKETSHLTVLICVVWSSTIPTTCDNGCSDAESKESDSCSKCVDCSKTIQWGHCSVCYH